MRKCGRSTRIRDWLADHALTAIVTAKLENRTSEALHYGFLQFMVDCVVRLGRRQEDLVCAQSIQITKYRGSDYAPAEFPLSIGPSGIVVAGAEPAEIGREASSERMSAGFERLDAMLGGGGVSRQQHAGVGNRRNRQNEHRRKLCERGMPAS